MLNDGGYNDTFKGLSNFLFYLELFFTGVKTSSNVFFP